LEVKVYTFNENGITQSLNIFLLVYYLIVTIIEMRTPLIFRWTKLSFDWDMLRKVSRTMNWFFLE